MISASYPAGPILPHGAYHLKKGLLPNVKYYPGNLAIEFNLLGGAAIADPMAPETVTITSLKGLVPPWQNIEQKGSTQDGSSYITSLYDPIDIELGVRIRGRDPFWTRKVVSDWAASWDAKIPGYLVWSTLEMGSWWASVRQGKPPIEAYTGGIGRTNEQKFTWPGKAYDAFWVTDDDTDFAFGSSVFQFLNRFNAGDQPMFDKYVCLGPGTFHFQDGPGSTNYVTYGPLTASQCVQIDTDPRKRGVVALVGTFDVPIIGAVTAVAPFSVNPYSLLQGRFSDNAGIPAKQPGVPATKHHVWVVIEGGNSNSTIVAYGTPKRRLPF
jgi:hypothetical protein